MCHRAEALVVPGVGAFGSCVAGLQAVGGDEIIMRAMQVGKPIFGICVGMQILFTEGIEKGTFKGLNLFSGVVEKLQAPVLPHIGWNTLHNALESKFYSGVAEEYFYFVHSYGVKHVEEKANPVWCEYGNDFVASVEKDNIFATQFHPEKSGDAGLRLIQNWVSSL